MQCLFSKSIYISSTTSILTTKITLAKDFSQYKLEQERYVPLNHYGVMNPFWTSNSSSYASCHTQKHPFYASGSPSNPYRWNQSMTLHTQNDLVSQVKGSLTLLTHESIIHRDLSEIPNGTLIAGHVQWTCSLTSTYMLSSSISSTYEIGCLLHK